jgi:ABC-2 type transport system permease protein
MNKTLLIFKHEFLGTIKRKGFIIMTLIVPVVALLAVGILALVAPASKPLISQMPVVGYVDKTGEFNDTTGAGKIKLVKLETQDDATRALLKNDIAEYFVISSDFAATGKVDRYTLKKQLVAPADIRDSIKNFLTLNMLAGKVPPDTIARVESPLNLYSTTLTETGKVAPEQGGYGNAIIPLVFSLLLQLSIVFSAVYLLTGLTEEKESRLIEVLLSSVSTRQLLVGKVLGIGLAGLLQIIVWVVSVPLLLSLASSTFGGLVSTLQIPANFILLCIVYFVLGYLLFAVLFAGIGAVYSNMREAQQLVTAFVLIAISPLWFTALLWSIPDNPVWVVLSIFPFTAPVQVILRLGVTNVAAWELVASITLLVLTIVGGLLLSARILRAYLLMYGKKPAFADIVRSLRS